MIMLIFYLLVSIKNKNKSILVMLLNIYFDETLKYLPNYRKAIFYLLPVSKINKSKLVK